MLPITFRRRLLTVITLPLLLVLLLAGVSIWQITCLLAAMEWVEHTDRVIADANRLQRLMADSESGIRGYLLTNQAQFLTPYQQANALVELTLVSLVDLVSDNPPQVERLTQIQSIYQTWKFYNPALLDHKVGDELPTAIVEKRNQLMGDIRDRMAEFIQIEEKLRDRRTQTVQRTTQVVIGTSILLAVLVGVLLAYFIWHQVLSVSRTYQQALNIAQEQTQAAELSAQRLTHLHVIDRAILAAESIEALAENALSKLKHVTGSAEATVLLFQDDSNQARILAGKIDGETAGNVIPTMEPILLEELKTQDAIFYSQDLATLPHRLPLLDKLLEEGYCCLLAVALQAENTLIGNLYLLDKQVNAFDLNDQEIAKEVADQMAIAIQQSRLRDELQRYANELEQQVAERTARLQEVNDTLEAFSYTVAHDLRAPLRGISGYTSALLEDYQEHLDEVAHQYVQQIFASIDRMNALIQDLLTYSYLSQEQIKLTSVDLNQVVNEAQAYLELDIREQNTEITVEGPLPKAAGHYSTLVQAVINLLSNAIKFVAPGIQPHIRIWAEEMSSQVRLWVEDNGIGIEPKYQEQIFGVFERLHARNAYPGTGIGLAIVRKGIERLGGRTGVESELNRGSRFWIELQKRLE